MNVMCGALLWLVLGALSPAFETIVIHAIWLVSVPSQAFTLVTGDTEWAALLMRRLLVRIRRKHRRLLFGDIRKGPLLMGMNKLLWPLWLPAAFLSVGAFWARAIWTSSGCPRRAGKPVYAFTWWRAA